MLKKMVIISLFLFVTNNGFAAWTGLKAVSKLYISDDYVRVYLYSCSDSSCSTCIDGSLRYVTIFSSGSNIDAKKIMIFDSFYNGATKTYDFSYTATTDCPVGSIRTSY